MISVDEGDHVWSKVACFLKPMTKLIQSGLNDRVYRCGIRQSSRSKALDSSTDPRLIRSNARTTSGSNLERNDFQPFANLPFHFYSLTLVAAAIESRADASRPKWRLEDIST